MRILWVSNSPIGPAADILGEAYPGSSGGWIPSEYARMDKQHTEWFFLSSLPSVKEGRYIKKANEEGTVYCVHTPKLSYGIAPGKKRQALIQTLLDEIRPDIIQIWGTETWLSNAVAHASTKAAKVIFIQGMIGIHQRYLGGYVKNNPVNRPYGHNSNVYTKLKAAVRIRYFKKQAAIEKETIGLCGNVIVDSDFARAYCRSISKNIRCFQHALLPNPLFFEKPWSLEACEKNTVFTVYGSSSEKGTQNLLWALSLVKRQIPDVKAYIPGSYQLDSAGRLKKTKNDFFQNTLYQMIHALDLQDNVVFTGKLSVSEMAESMNRCHVFVNTSCMETQAFSLREAMAKGVPCITSLCGFAAEFIRHGENGLLYRYEEYEALAYLLEQLLTDGALAAKLSDNTKTAFDGMTKDSLSLHEIYKQLLSYMQ